MSKHTLTWKVAVAGGAVLGAGFGSVALAGADDGTPPSTVEVEQLEQLEQLEQQLSSPGAPLSVIPAPAVDLSKPASADSAVTPTPDAVAPADVQDVESVASPATPALAPSAPSAQQADVAPPPAPAAEESAPSPATPEAPAEAVAPVEVSEPDSPPSPTSPPAQMENPGDESGGDED